MRQVDYPPVFLYPGTAFFIQTSCHMGDLTVYETGAKDGVLSVFLSDPVHRIPKRFQLIVTGAVKKVILTMGMGVYLSCTNTDLAQRRVKVPHFFQKDAGSFKNFFRNIGLIKKLRLMAPMVEGVIGDCYADTGYTCIVGAQTGADGFAQRQKYRPGLCKGGHIVGNRHGIAVTFIGKNMWI